MHKLRRLLVRLDEAVYAVERIVLLISVLMMIVLVFADVVQRTFSRPVGKTADFMVWFAGLFGELSPDTVQTIEGTLANTVFGVLALLFCVAGAQSARNFKARAGAVDEEASAPFGPSVAIGAGVFLLSWGVIEALLYVAPQGIPGAQKFALGFLVWSGFIGASLATRARRHIVLDAVKKKLGDERPLYGLFGALLTAGFCLFVSFMGYAKGFVQIEEWSASEHMIHTFESIPVPTWIVTFAIPVFLTIAALRFLALGVGELLFGAPLVGGADEHGIDLEALEREQAAAAADTAAADGAFVIGRPHGVAHEEVKP